jgi:hypothetical protein
MILKLKPAELRDPEEGSSGFQRDFAPACARADAKLHAGLGLKGGFKLIGEA